MMTGSERESAEKQDGKTVGQQSNTAKKGAKKAPTRSRKTQARSVKNIPTAQAKDSKVAVPKRSNGRGKYDWPSASALFIEGVPEDPAKPEGNKTWLNLKEISERTGIPYQRVRQKSSDDRWPEKRQNYQTILARKRMEARSKKIVAEAAEFDDRALDVAKMGTQLVARRMAEISQEVREQVKKKELIQAKLDANIPVERWEWKWIDSRINSGELERLAKAQALFQEIGMKALGTDVLRTEISGPNGSPIGVEVEHSINVSRELLRDDPDRLSAFLAAASRAGVFDQLAELEGDDTEGLEPTPEEIAAQEELAKMSDDIVDAELVEE